MGSVNNRKLNTIFASSPFDPRSIPGLKLWLAADRIVGLNDGDPVGTWSDLSGNGNDATQATGSKKPLYKAEIVNGKPVVRFDGVDDVLSIVDSLSTNFGSSGFTILLIVRTNSLAPSGYKGILAKRTNPNWKGWSVYQVNAAATFACEVAANNAGPYFDAPNISIPDTSNFLIIAHTTNRSEKLHAYKNGTEQGSGTSLASLSGTTDNSTALTVGQETGTGNLSGDIAEICLYGSALSTSDRKQLEKYLGAKYGITVS